jgi:SAM-dependent methyltransferase
VRLAAISLDSFKMSAAGTFVSWEDAVSWLRRQPGMAQLVRECYYDDPPLEAAQRYFASEEWQAVRALLSGRRGLALDIGAGRGIASYALARDGFEVVALEPDPSELVGAGAIRALARESGLPIGVVESTSEHLPFASATFDVVFARAALHHTRDLAAACAEFFRVLKPGGLLVAIREHVISRRADLPRFLEQHPLHRLYGGENALLLSQYRAALGGAGFHRLAVLTPWSSPINYAPRTLAELKDELALRMTTPLPRLRRLVRAGLGVGAFWRVLSALLERIDHRPGRLYSFVAQP